MTPSREEPSNGDAAKLRLTLRDALLLFVGGCGMLVAQVGVTSGLRSDIRDAITRMDNQQQQINEWRGETKVNRENINNLRQEVSELKGMLQGAGVLKGGSK